MSEHSIRDLKNKLKHIGDIHVYEEEGMILVGSDFIDILVQGRTLADAMKRYWATVILEDYEYDFEQGNVSDGK